jgi:hypothetical protein
LGEDFTFMTDEQIELERLMKEQEENIIARSKTNTICVASLQVHETRAVFGDDDDDVDVDDV